jgi:hypothetical protein
LQAIAKFFDLFGWCCHKNASLFDKRSESEVIGQEEHLAAKGIRVIATRHRYFCWLFSLLFVLTLDVIAHAQSNENCTASILNRTTRVNPDGTFVIDNIPSNQGLGRVRIICPDTSGNRGGASDFTRIVPGGDVSVGNVPLGVIPPSVKSLAVTVTPTTLTGAGATAQLSDVGMCLLL